MKLLKHIFIALVLTVLASQTFAGKVTVTTNDGAEIAGALKSVGNQFGVKTQTGIKNIALSKISNVNFGRDSKFAPGTCAIEKNDGSIIVSDKLVVEGEAVVAKMISGESMKINFKHIATIWLPGKKQTVDDVKLICKNKNISSGAKDQIVMIKKSGEIAPLTCQFVGIGKEKISFIYKNKTRKLKRSRALAVYPGNLPAKINKPANFVVLVDGSRLRFDNLALNDSKIAVESDQYNLQIPVEKISSISLLSASVKLFADLKPSAIKYEKLLGLGFQVQKNRSSLGKHLVLDGKKFTAGMGVFAGTKLSYDLDAKYKTFVCKIGIDDNAKPLGNAVAIFSVDGKEVKRVKVLSSQHAVDVKIDLAGAKKFTIEIKPDQPGKISGCHVDIVSARLLK